MRIRKSIHVKTSVANAFRRFTADIGKWWPLREGFSFDRERAHEIFLEPGVGGRFFERYRDGAEHEVGRVTAWEPPARVAFSWKQPGWEGPTEVEVRFLAEGDGTRVELEHRGWESAGDAARRVHDRYAGGWQLLLSRYVASLPESAPDPTTKESSMRLHVFPPSPRATKVMAAAFHLDLECEMRVVNLFRGEQHAPEYAALNPNERMPTLEDGDFVLWESNAILFYLASKKPESGLWPAGARAQADALRWMEWEAAHLTPACAPLAFERVVKKLAGLGEPDPAEVARGERELRRAAPVLDSHLRGRRWLVGESPTVADFAIGGAFVMATPAAYPLEPYREITRWYAGLAALPGWQKALAAAAAP